MNIVNVCIVTILPKYRPFFRSQLDLIWPLSFTKTRVLLQLQGRLHSLIFCLWVTTAAIRYYRFSNFCYFFCTNHSYFSLGNLDIYLERRGEATQFGLSPSSSIRWAQRSPVDSHPYGVQTLAVTKKDMWQKHHHWFGNKVTLNAKYMP